MTIDRQIKVHIPANCDGDRFGEPPEWGIINCFLGRVFSPLRPERTPAKSSTYYPVTFVFPSVDEGRLTSRTSKIQAKLIPRSHT
jgi:hypothetical protein